MSEARNAPQTLRKGDTATVRISQLAPGGEGVSRDLGLPVFINRVAPGDLVEAHLFDVRKDFAKGEVTRLVEASPLRAEPPCKLFKVCGGCQWQHLSYDAQLDAKAEIVRQALKHIAKLPPDMVQPTLAAENPLYYRNKVQFPVGTVPKTGRILAGYYQQNSHELVNVKHCPVQPEPLDRVLSATKDALEKQQLSVYDEKTGKGLIRHIIERYSAANNKVLVTIVINSASTLTDGMSRRLDEVARAVMESVPEVSGFCLNFNESRGNRIIGDVTETIAGETYLIERLKSVLPAAPEQLKNGIDYRLSATSFFQINSAQAAVLLDQVLLGVLGQSDKAPDAKVPLIVDAYAGVGTMALWLAAIAQKVIAIEEWPSAVDDAKANCGINQVTNVEFLQDKVEAAIPKMLKDGLKPDVIVLDPPRKGVDAQALGQLVQLGARRIVYVSCNPATLARDLKILADSGYKTTRIQPIDMFPQTYHVESVSILEKTQ